MSNLDNWYLKQIDKIIHEAGHKITKNLQNEADKGSTFAKGCLMSWALSEMLDFGIGDVLDTVGSLLNPFKGVLKGVLKSK